MTLTVLVTFSWLIGAVFAQGSRPDVKDPKLIAEGDAVFAKSCSIPYCHGKEGTAGRAPALNNRKWDIAQLHQVILKGVPNSSMPNWDDKLSEREIWAAVAYVLSISADASPDKNAPPPPAAQSGRTAQPAVSAGALPESLVGLPSRGKSSSSRPAKRGVPDATQSMVRESRSVQTLRAIHEKARWSYTGTLFFPAPTWTRPSSCCGSR